MRSTEFIGIAETIRSNEINCRSRIDSLNSRLENLRSDENSCISEIQLCEARISAAMMETDEDGDPDYSLIAMLEGQLEMACSRLESVRSAIDNTQVDLQHTNMELTATLQEKQTTLQEVERRAAITSSNIQSVSGMYGRYAVVGAKMQNSFQGTLSSLSQAAGILGGSVSVSAPGGSGVSSQSHNARGSSRSASGKPGSRSGLSGQPSSASFGSGQLAVHKGGKFSASNSKAGDFAKRSTSFVTHQKSHFSAGSRSAASGSGNKGIKDTSEAQLNSVQRPIAQKTGKHSGRGGDAKSVAGKNSGTFRSAQSKGKAARSKSSASVRVMTDPKQIAEELQKLYASGELEADIVVGTKNVRGMKYLPTSRLGKFTGQRGNSLFIPHDEEAKKVLREFGLKGVEYHNNQPDFHPFTYIRTPWGLACTEVTIGYMGTERLNKNVYTSTGAVAYTELGNFAQADIALCLSLNRQFPSANITIADVRKFRKENRLTWHECADLKTMQLIPTAIHDSCKHIGAIGILKYGQRLSMVDYDSVSYKSGISSHFSSFMSDSQSDKAP